MRKVYYFGDIVLYIGLFLAEFPSEYYWNIYRMWVASRAEGFEKVEAGNYAYFVDSGKICWCVFYSYDFYI